MEKLILEKLIKEITGNPLIGIEINKFGEELDTAGIKDLENELAVSLPQTIRNLYTQFNGLKFKWKTISKGQILDNDDMEGSIRILALNDMITGYEGMLWLNELWFENMPLQEKSFYQSLKIFDYYSYHSIECVCLQMSDKRELLPKFWLFVQGFPAMELTIPFPEYFNLLYKTKGIWGWQYFYVNKSLRDKRFLSIRKKCEFIIEEYGKFFQDNFEQELKRRYIELKK